MTCMGGGASLVAGVTCSLSSPFEAGFGALFTTTIVFGTLGESLARLLAGEGEGVSSLCLFLPAI